MFINLYIARPTYRFILIYTCGLTAVIKRICYVMLCYVVGRGQRAVCGSRMDSPSVAVTSAEAMWPFVKIP